MIGENSSTIMINPAKISCHTAVLPLWIFGLGQRCPCACQFYTSNLNLAKSKKCFSDKVVRTSGPILWNSLTDSLKMTNAPKRF